MVVTGNHRNITPQYTLAIQHDLLLQRQAICTITAVKRREDRKSTYGMCSIVRPKICHKGIHGWATMSMTDFMLQFAQHFGCIGLEAIECRSSRITNMICVTGTMKELGCCMEGKVLIKYTGTHNTGWHLVLWDVENVYNIVYTFIHHEGRSSTMKRTDKRSERHTDRQI